MADRSYLERLSRELADSGKMVAREKRPYSERRPEHVVAKNIAAKIKRRAEQQKRLRENPGLVCGRDGRVIVPKKTVGTCELCVRAFSFVMTTKPERYCASCKVIRLEQRRLRNNAARTRKTKPKETPRLIRYAGYDESEQHLYGDTAS